MIDPATLEALTKLRNDIFAKAKANQTPTVVKMAQTATMFLDTTYMWLSTMDQVIDEQKAGMEAAGQAPNVTQGDFTPPANG